MPESNQVAIYFLLGETDDADLRVYIGQTGDLRARLAKHNRERDFWERALVVISRTNNLTLTHAVYLEWYCLRECRLAGRYTDENGNCGSQPYTPPPLQADCLEVFDTAKILIASLGYPLFTPVASSEDTDEQGELFYCRRNGADGRGVFTAEGFVVLSGSFGPKDTADSLIGHSYEKLREDLIRSATCVIEGEHFVFKRDHLFRKPSQASAAVLGRSSNGWVEWKTQAGKTLDQVKRQEVDSAGN
jgi:hypothetical protein